MANLKINVNKAKYQEITEKEKGFRHPLPATLQNISFLFNYKKFPPLMVGDTKVETTRTRFLNMVNNTETRNQAILYLKKFKTVEFCSWGRTGTFEFEGLEVRHNKETDSNYFVIKVGKFLQQKQTTL
jgi:hypothetical protein